MTFKKLNKYTLMTTIPAGIILITSLTSAFSFNNQITQNLQTTEVASPFADTTVQTDPIDMDKVNKSNWTWPNDKYQSTQGYSFTNIENKDTKIFTINKSGFYVNGSYPNYSKKTSVVKSNSGIPFEMKHFPQYANLSLFSQQFNLSTGFSGLQLINSQVISFGNTNNDKLTGWNNYDLNFASPFLNIKVPIADYIINRTWGNNDGCALIGQGSFNDARSHLWTNSVNSNWYEGVTELYSSAQDGTHQSPIDNIDATHWHSKFNVYFVNISIYNDYTKDGDYLDTYLFDSGNVFNSSLPTMEINETLLDKKINALRNNTNVKGMIKLSNAQAIPSISDGIVSSIKDVTAGKITFNYKPSFIFSNGTLQKYTGSGVSQVVTGFSLLNTFISSRNGYSDVIVVDRFINSIRKDGIIDAAELGKYLDLSSVPPDSEYSILDSSITTDLVKGTIGFQIKANNGYNYDDTLTHADTPYYTVNLQLTPRITKITYTGMLDDILVNQYYDRVFDETGLVNLEEFNKYASIIAPVDNAQYYLVPDSYKTNTGDGNVNFKLYASTYYGADAQEKNSSITDTATHFDVNLVLNPLASIVEEKTAVTPAHRVDKFIDLVTNTDGSVKDLDLLKQYVDIQNIPNAATYTINPASVAYDSFNDDFYYEYVNFDLVVSKYNETSFVVDNNRIIPLRVKLNAVHLQTKITAKLPSEYDATIRLDRLLPKIIDTDNNVINRALLEEYVNIEALPQASALKIDNIVRTDATGVLNFNIIPTIAYDNDSNKLTGQIYPVELTLTMRHQPTVIVANDNLVGAERVDRFAQKLQSFTNSNDLITYLTAAPGEPAYIDISGEFPIPTNEVDFQIRNLEYLSAGNLSFNLIASAAYDTDAEVAGATVFPISLQLAQKHIPTNLSLLSHYPSGSTTVEFEKLANDYYQDSQPAFRTFLSRFINGVETIPASANVTWMPITVDAAMGKITFSVEASTYYDTQSDLIAGVYTSVPFTLNLIPQDQVATLTTSVEWQADVAVSGKAQDFYNLINPHNQVDYAQLSNYLALNNIPIDATITIVNKDPEFKSPLFLSFDVVLTQWWENGTLKPESGDVATTKTIPLERNLFILNVNSKSLTFPWWWIAVGIAGVILLLTTYFLAKQYKENKLFKDQSLSQK